MHSRIRRAIPRLPGNRHRAIANPCSSQFVILRGEGINSATHIVLDHARDERDAGR